MVNHIICHRWTWPGETLPQIKSGPSTQLLSLSCSVLNQIFFNFHFLYMFCYFYVFKEAPFCKFTLNDLKKTQIWISLTVICFSTTYGLSNTDINIHLCLLMMLQRLRLRVGNQRGFSLCLTSFSDYVSSDLLMGPSFFFFWLCLSSLTHLQHDQWFRNSPATATYTLVGTN